MKKIIKYSSRVVLLLAAIGAPFAALAQSGGDSVSNGLGSIGQSFGGFNSNLAQSQTVGGLAAEIINILLTLAGIVAVLFLIIGGYQYLTAQGNAEQAEKGKSTVVNAIIGVVIIILSFVIVNVVVNLVGAGRIAG